MGEVGNIPMQQVAHTLDLFGQYGGLIGLVIAMLFFLLAAVLYFNSRSRDAQTAALNTQVGALATSISNQSKEMSQAIREGMAEQAKEFVAALEQIRTDHHKDRDRMMGTIEELAGVTKKAQSRDGKKMGQLTALQRAS